MKKVLIFLFAFVVLFRVAGQSSHELRLGSGTFTPTENAKTFVMPDLPSGGFYYCIWQFYSTPTTTDRENLTNQGIEFVEYLPYHAYIVGVPSGFSTANITGLRAIVPMTAPMKMSRALREPPYPSHAIKGDMAGVRLRYFAHSATLAAALSAMKVDVVGQNETYKVLTLWVPISELANLAARNDVQFIEFVSPPPIKEDRLGRTLARTNLLDAEYASGRHYTGEGVRVALRDDGEVGPHIDFQNRIVQDAEPVETSGSHGDMTGGIMVGAGNLDPTIRGTATGAFMYVRDYFGDLEEDDVLTLHISDSVMAVSTSYSDGCNAGYTLNTVITETEMFEHPSFLHVFSAGNANNQDCGYGAGLVWGNITGGHKAAKNCIATANLMRNGVIDNSSSRGPAHDGRIKPDISSNGTDQLSTAQGNTYQVGGGTSAASPGIGGTAAQLYQVYRQFHDGNDPDAALIKATMLNTANDIGVEGPDFIYGWGRVNALRAAMTLESSSFVTSNLAQAQAPNTHIIAVPAGTKQVKFMLYWADIAASESAAVALVNDLDLVVNTPNSQILLPWRPDATPNIATLGNAATTGTDHLNNVEQVSIIDPAAGDYTLQVSGFDIPFGAVDYYIVYEIIADAVSLTYPVGGEGFAPGETVRIHWDAVGNTTPFSIDLSTDNGQNWSSVGVAPASIRMFDWVVPNVVTGQAWVRVTRVNDQDTGEAAFNIIRIPTPTVGQACPSDVSIWWPSIEGADSYTVYQLGEKYMDSIVTVTDTFVNLPIASLSIERWFAVNANHSSGIRGRRCTAIPQQGLVNCTLANNAQVTQNTPLETAVSCEAVSVPVGMIVQNAGQNDMSNFEVGYQYDNYPPVIETFSGVLGVGIGALYVFTEPLAASESTDGILRTWVKIPADEYEYDDTLATPLNFNIISGMAMPDFEETFEGGSYPPADWFVANPDDGITWEKSGIMVTGSDGNPTYSTMIDNYNYATIGQEDRIFSTPIDLQAAVSPYLVFDLAYAPYNATYNDSLRIEIYTNCSSQYLGTIYAKDSDQLATVGATTTVFFPTDQADWRTEIASLNDYIGQVITVAFVGITGYGNSLHLDNIGVLGNLVIETPVADFATEADTACRNTAFEITDASTGNMLNYDWSFGTTATPATATGPGPHNITWAIAGNKTIELTISNPAGESTATKSVYVRQNPGANFNYTDDGSAITFDNTSTNAASYLWSFGDTQTSTEENPVHSYALGGTYVVTLTATNDCSSSSKVRTVDATVGTDDTSTSNGIGVQPNPNNGQFILVTPHGIAQKALLVAADGRTVRTFTITQSHQSLDAADLPSGSYTLRVVTDKGIVSRRIIIEK